MHVPKGVTALVGFSLPGVQVLGAMSLYACTNLYFDNFTNLDAENNYEVSTDIDQTTGNSSLLHVDVAAGVLVLERPLHASLTDPVYAVVVEGGEPVGYSNIELKVQVSKMLPDTTAAVGVAFCYEDPLSHYLVKVAKYRMALLR